MNADPKRLRNLDTDPYIFVPGKKYGVADCVISCELDQVGDDERINAFLLTCAIQKSKAQFDVIHISEDLLLGRRPTHTPVVPVDSQQRHTRGSHVRNSEEFTDRRLLIQADQFSRLLLPCKQGGPLREQIASIHKCCDTIHFPLPNKKGSRRSPV